MLIFFYIIFIFLCSLIPLKGLAQQDTTGSSLFTRAVERFNAEDYNVAILLLDSALRKNPSMTRAYDYLGLSMAELGLCRQADGFFRQGLKRDSLNLSLLIHAAQTALICGYAFEAKSYYLRAIGADTFHTKAMLNVARIYQQESNYDSALILLERVIKLDSNSLVSHYLMGSIYGMIKKYDLAVQALNKALKIHPTYLLALKDLGWAYLQLDSLMLATISYKQALYLQPGNVALKIGLAYCYFKRKKYDDALSLYKDAEIDPHILTSSMQQGLCYFYLSKYDSALHKFEKATAIDSTNSLAYFNLGLTHIELKRFKSAIRNFESAIRHSRNNLISSAYDRIGASYYELKKKNASLGAYQRSVLESPLNAIAYYNMAVLYENLFKDSLNASRFYRMSLKLSEPTTDENSLYRKAKKRLAFLRKGRK